ncbi:MAG: TerD family protein [Synergistaceae bacterium]|nr:TerD family protein [Synergistaceae bacterium]
MVNLQKGQKVELRKSDGGSLKKVVIGLGWDEIKKESGGFLGGLFGGGKKTHDIDCDATVFLCVNGKVTDSEDVVYFGNLKHSSGAVRHMGDNLTGAGEGDDEEIFIDLTSLPAKYDKIIFVVNIYKANERGQHFGMINNAFIRIYDGDNNQELCRYNLSENYDSMTAMIFGEMYLRNGQWKFNAIGQATHDNSISELLRRFA